MRTFEFRKIDRGSKAIEDVFRLRYQVYCTEWGFEDPADYPDGLERDKYDDYSVHFGAYLEGTDEIVGTTRIIVDPPFDMPIEKNFSFDRKISSLRPGRIGEISRFAVSKQFMRRVADKALMGADVEIPDDRFVKDERRRLSNDMIAGLYKCIWNESQELELTHWYAGMAKSLYLILRRWRIVFNQIGPEADYHGLRGPYLGSIAETRKSLQRRNPRLLEFFEDSDRGSFSSQVEMVTGKRQAVAGG